MERERSSRHLAPHGREPEGAEAAIGPLQEDEEVALERYGLVHTHRARCIGRARAQGNALAGDLHHTYAGCVNDPLIDQVSLDPIVDFDEEFACRAFTEYEQKTEQCDTDIVDWGLSVNGLPELNPPGAECVARKAIGKSCQLPNPAEPEPKDCSLRRCGISGQLSVSPQVLTAEI